MNRRRFLFTVTTILLMWCGRAVPMAMESTLPNDDSGYHSDWPAGLRDLAGSKGRVHAVNSTVSPEAEAAG